MPPLFDGLCRDVWHPKGQRFCLSVEVGWAAHANNGLTSVIISCVFWFEYDLGKP
jgi:hypothetical protein